jgi:hypothetical protein
MRFLPVLFPLSLVACAPAFAQANADTYREVVAHGVVMIFPDFEIDVSFKPDGTFTAMKGASKGKWRIEDNKLCSTPDETLMETCAVYPAGKKSGDRFVIPAPRQDVTVRIP